MSAKPERQNCFNSEKILRFDSFGEPPRFLYEDGKSEYRTVFGSGINFCIAISILLFAIAQLMTVFTRSGTLFTTSRAR